MSPIPPKDERIIIRVAADDLARWRATADADAMTLSDWIRRRCNEVAVDQETIDVVAKKMADEAKRRGRKR